MNLFFFKKKITQLLNDLRAGEKVGEQSIRKYLVRGSTGSLIVKISSIALKFLTGVILARILGPVGLGDYSYVLAIITMLVIPTQLGLPELLVREVSAYKAKCKWSLLKGILLRSNQFVLFTSLLLIAISCFVLIITPDYFDPQVKNTFWWALPMLVLIPLAALRSASLRGLKEVVLGILPEQVIKPASLLVAITILLIFGTDTDWFTAESVMAMTSGSVLLAFIIGAYWLNEKLPNKVKSTESSYNTKLWIKSAMPFLVLGGLNIINQKIDLVLIGNLGTSEQVGLFEVANRAANFVAISLTAINQVVGPLFSSLWAKQDFQRLQKVLTKSTQVIFALSLPVALLFIFAGDWILELFFGTEYGAAGKALAILCGGYLFNAIMGSIGVLLNMSGNERYTAFGVGISVFSNILLNIWLIPVYGIEGAAIASMASFILWNTFLGYIVYKKLNIVPSLLYTFKSKYYE